MIRFPENEAKRRLNPMRGCSVNQPVIFCPNSMGIVKLGVLLGIFAGFTTFLPSAVAQSNTAALPAVGQAELNILTPTLLELSLITTKEPDPAPVSVWNFVAPDYSLKLPAPSEFEVKAG